jgi:signal transduction histidine kinase
MSVWRPVAITLAVAVAGGLGTLAVAAASGMPGDELERLALLLLPAIALTLIAAAALAPALARASARQRLIALGLISALVALANLLALARLMFLSGHEAGEAAILLLYSMTAGVGVALGLARASAVATERLGRVARRLAGGDLEARAGRLGAGPELDALAASLDEMAARLGEAIDRERAAEAQRRDLVTAVSHDLRTPLAGLRAMVEAIDDRVVKDQPTVRRYAAEMRSALESLTVLVDDLFELVQLEAGAIAAESERAPLEDVVSSAMRACDAQAAEKGLVVVTRLDGAGGASCSPRVGRVVQNLLQNAIRHTPSDGTVRIEARRVGEGLELVVADSGEGIPGPSLERVFDPFWRGDAARAGSGSGLGLALAKRIVESLGGQITVESEPAHGSRFAVVLPG